MKKRKSRVGFVVVLILGICLACWVITQFSSRNDAEPIAQATKVTAADDLDIGATQAAQESGAEQEEPTATPEPPKDVQEPTPTVISQPQAGIGVSRVEIQSVFESSEIGFIFKVASDVDGQPRVMGSSENDLATLELIGPPEELVSASIMIGLPNNDQEALLLNNLYAAGLLNLVAPDWEGGIDWYTDNIVGVATTDQTEISTTHQDLKISLQGLQELGIVLLAIKPNSTTPLPIPTDTLEPEQANPVEEVKAIVAAGESDVNLRSGPSQEFAVVGTLPAGQTLEIIGRNADSTWWQVYTSNGDVWIAASVTTASNTDENIPIVAATPNQATEPDTGSQENEQEQAEQSPSAEEPAPVSDGTIIITVVDKGAEFVEIQNVSSGPIDLSGWRLLSEKGEQNCNLGSVIQPNEILRIWALSDKADQGGFNCGFEGNIWNNSETDPAVIYDLNGVEVFRVNCKSKVCQ